MSNINQDLAAKANAILRGLYYGETTRDVPDGTCFLDPAKARFLVFQMAVMSLSTERQVVRQLQSLAKHYHGPDRIMPK